MPRRRFTIGRMMGVTALIAVGCAVARWEVGAYVLGWVGVMAGVILAVARWGGTSRIRAATWVCAAYPWAALLALNGVALLDWARRRSLVGVPPGSSGPFDRLSFGVQVVALILLLGLGVAWVASLGLAIGQGIGAAERRGAGRGDEVSRLVLIPLFLWLGALLAFAAENAWVTRWLRR